MNFSAARDHFVESLPPPSFDSQPLANDPWNTLNCALSLPIRVLLPYSICFLQHCVFYLKFEFLKVSNWKF